MKKVLFATTALVASAGIASAQGVSVSGFAEMGVAGGSAIETQFFQDIDVTFSMSGETDNGLTFGAAVDLDESFGATNAALADNFDDGGVAIFLSGSFGTLTMGDTDGAFDWALTEVAMGGSIADDHTAHAGYNGNAGLDGNYDGQIVRYDYSFGDFAFAASIEADDTGAGGDPIFGIGGTYSGDLGGINVGLGVGYQTGGVSGDRAVGASLTAAMDNGIEVRGNYSSIIDGGVEATHIGVGAAYTMDAITVAANYGIYNPAAAGVDNSTGFGIAANYDLGGGAVVQAGYGSGSTAGAADVNTFSLGVAMSF